MTPKNQWASANALAKQTGAGRQHIQRWCSGVPTRRRGQRVFYARTEALAAIAEHQREPEDNPAVDGTDALQKLMSRHVTCRQMLTVLADGGERIEEAIVNGKLGISEDQGRHLLAMLSEPWEQCRKLIPAAEQIEAEGAK